jgi:flagellar biosynthesis/type III secretory pathway M-ring protein FliF/YscJ
MSTDERKQTEQNNQEGVETTEALKNFENRWKYAVFPAMIAFVLLASFGFYLIYNMLQRMEDLSRDVNRMVNVLEKSMPSMTNDVHALNKTISNTLPSLKHEIAAMSQEMKRMTHSTESLSATTRNMGHNLWEVNKNISTPLSIMNSVVPWSRVSAPQPVAYQYYQQAQPVKQPYITQ